MSLTDNLSMNEWQRRRNAQLLGSGVGVDRAPLSDDMPMEAWQRARMQQLAGDTLAGGGDDAPAAGEGSDRLGAGPTAPAFNVDRQFLAVREGARSDMYLPEDPRTHQVLDDSGPTIGVGVDLGRKDVAYLKSLGIDPALATKLSPYLGRRGAEASAYVKANPLVLAGPELNALNTAVQDRELRKLAEKFDEASKVGPFHQLPKDTQTAIASLYFQYGTDAPEKATPNYWRQITSGDWNGAYQNLQNFGDNYKTRRKAESDRLLRDIKSGTLPRPRANTPTAR